MNKARTVKKYPNRRLYDLQLKRYITLHDIRKLVLEHIDFVVVAANARTDITDQVLLQVLTANHRRKSPIDRAFLTQAIRAQAATDA